MKFISSGQNQEFKKFQALRERKGRRQQQAFLVEGLKENAMALKAGFAPQTWLVPETPSSKVQEFMQASPDCSVLSLADHLFTKLAVRELSVEIMGVYAVRQQSLNDIKLSEKPLILIADDVEKPGNLGAILRSCDAFGVDALLLTGKGVDAFSPNVIRSSLGSVFLLPVVSTSYEEAVSFCRHNNISLWLAKPDLGTPAQQATLDQACAVVVGSESLGVSAEWENYQVEQQLKIPMHGEMDSLNASVAAAIVLYEARRQRL